MKLHTDYRDVIACLKARKVEFLVVGAYAMAAHGYIRATTDIDMWVNPTSANAKRVFAALKEFGAPLIDVTIEDFAKNDTVYQMGVAPVRIDIITGISGVEFPAAWREHDILDLDGIALPVLSIPDLISNKSATGRPKDRLDVPKLKRLQKKLT